MNHQTKHWLDTAEFLSLSAAVVGTVASGVSQQAILATAPLSVTLALNLANRRRVDRLLRRDANASIQHLHQDFLELNQLLSGGVEGIRQQLLSLPAPPEQIDFSPVEGVIAAVRTELESRLLELEMVDFDSVRYGVDHLQSELAQLREQIQALFQNDLSDRAIALDEEFDPAQMFDLEPLATARTAESGEMTRLQRNTIIPTEAQSFTLTDSEIGSLQEWQNAMAQEVITAVRTEIQNSLPPMSAADASTIQERLLQLQAAIGQLNSRLQMPHQASLDFSSFQTQIDQLGQRLDRLPVSLDSTALEQRVEDLRTAIVQLSDEVKNPPANDDTALIFSAMRSLYERQNSMEQDFISNVRTEIQNALAATPVLSAAPTADSAAMRDEIADLRLAIAQLHKEFQQTAQQTAQPSNDLTLFQAQVNDGIAQLRLEMVQLQNKLHDTTPVAPDTTALETQMKDGFLHLQAAIVQLQNNVRSAAPASVDLTPLQAQMEQINRRLDQLPPAFDATPLEQRIDELSNTLAQWRGDKNTPVEDSEFIFSAMRSLYERQGSLEQEITAAVRSEFQKQVVPLIEFDADAIQAGILQLQVEVSQLKNQLHTATQPKPVDLSPVQNQINQLNRRFDQQPPPFDSAPLEQRVEDLRATIAAWKEEMENSPIGEDLKIFLSAMRGMYDRRNGREG